MAISGSRSGAMPEAPGAFIRLATGEAALFSTAIGVILPLKRRANHKFPPPSGSGRCARNRESLPELHRGCRLHRKSAARREDRPPIVLRIQLGSNTTA